MRLATFYDSQFVSADSENQAFSQVRQSLSDLVASLFTPGVLGLTSSAFSTSGLTVSADLSAVRLIFSTGVVGLPLGTSDGSTTASYSVDMSGYVPSSGTQTVYLVATPVSIGANPSVISGPPPGNPDYDPTFTPYTAYLAYLDSFSVSASTSAPVAPSIEIGRFSLSQGMAALPAIDISDVVYAGVANVTEWDSPQIVNAASITGLLESYLTQAASDKRYLLLSTSALQTVTGPVTFSVAAGGLKLSNAPADVPKSGNTGYNVPNTAWVDEYFLSNQYGMGTGDSPGISLFYSKSAAGPWFTSAPWTGQLARQTDVNTVATTASNAAISAATAQSTANSAVDAAATAQSTANSAQDTANTAVAAAGAAQTTANAAVNGATTSGSQKRGESLYLADNGYPSFGYDGGSVQLALLSQIVSNAIRAEAANQRIERGTSASAAAGSFVTFNTAFSDLPAVVVQNNGGGEDNVHAYNVQENGFYLEINGGGSSGIQYLAMGNN